MLRYQELQEKIEAIKRLKAAKDKVVKAPGVKHAIAGINYAGKKAFSLRKKGPWRSKKNRFKDGSTAIAKRAGLAHKIHAAQAAGIGFSPVNPHAVAAAIIAHHPAAYPLGKAIGAAHLAHAIHATSRTGKVKDWAKNRIGKAGNRE